MLATKRRTAPRVRKKQGRPDRSELGKNGTAAQEKAFEREVLERQWWKSGKT
jgi:hypothetical protein